MGRPVVRRGAGRSAYAAAVSGPLLVALVLILAVLVALPARRLYAAGWRGWPLLVYFVGVIGLGVLVAELRAPARFLVPILVVAYIAPFVTLRAGIGRLTGRPNDPAPRQVKDVTPRDGSREADGRPDRDGDDRPPP